MEPTEIKVYVFSKGNITRNRGKAAELFHSSSKQWSKGLVKALFPIAGEPKKKIVRYINPSLV